MHKESANDESFNFINFISSTISMWTQHVPQGLPISISICALETLLHESNLVNYESMVYVYCWMMEEHRPIVIDY